MSIGYHVGKIDTSLAKSIEQSVSNAKQLGVSIGCVQIFVMGPQSSHVNVDTNDIKALKLVSDSINIYVHSSYITANIYNESTRGYANTICKKQMNICEDINASGFVVHMPRDTPEVAASGFKLVNKYRVQTPIFMEIEVAKPPKFTYETPEKLSLLTSALRKVSPGYGICIDTAHLWSCGESLSDPLDTKQWLRKYDELRVPQTLVHLNDSGQDFGSGRDSHMTIGKGNIWDKYHDNLSLSGAYEVLRWAHSRSIDVVLERNEEGLIEDLGNIRRFNMYR